MKRKIGIGIAAFILVGIIANKSYAQVENHYTLIKEVYDGGSITRIYQDDKTKKHIYLDIDVPSDLKKVIEQSKDPLLEAKKQLTKRDTELGLTEKLAELNNQKLYKYEAELSVDSNLKKTFDSQKQEAQEFATSNSDKKTADTTKTDDLDYSQIDAKIKNQNAKQDEQIVKQVNQDMKQDKNEDKKQISEEKAQTQSIKRTQTKEVVIALVIIILIFGVGIYTVRKKVK